MSDAVDSDDPIERTVVPRFSIRTLLIVLTFCAFAFVVLGTAYRGQIWAWGVTIGLVSVLVTALAHGTWFGLVWLFAQMTSGRRDGSE
jgi:hypothetical protein